MAENVITKLYALVFFIIFFIQASPLQSQQSADSLELSLEEYLRWVLEHHPYVQRADLQTRFGEAEVRRARGMFDPKIAAQLDEKEFKKTNYYSLKSAGIKIPTWFGVTALMDYQDNEGVFLNPEANTPEQGLTGLGIEANLMQGLLIDDRRATLRKAKIYADLADNKRQIIINDLLADAFSAYLNWQNTIEASRILDSSIVIAEQYYKATKLSFENGDKPAIDTLEAFLILQDRWLLKQENDLLVADTRQYLENFLWLDTRPIELEDHTLPQPLEDTDIAWNPTLNIEDILRTQPDLIKNRLQINIYNVERRLKANKLLPKLAIKYQPLVDNGTPWVDNFSTGQYSWGLKFSVPLLLRSERGELLKAKLKIQESQLELDNKRNELINKLEANFLKEDILRNQLLLQRSAIDNYERMLEAELIRFSIGESSVFLVNKRQEKYIESQLKLIKTKLKLLTIRLEYLYVSNEIEEWVQTYIYR